MAFHGIRFSACSLVLLALPHGAFAESHLADRAQTVLKVYCGHCHSRDGKAKGGFDYVLDRDVLVARKKIVPGKPGESEIFQKAHNGEMPPKSVSARPSKDDLAVLERWIAAGAPAWKLPVSKGLPETEVYQRIAADLRAVPEWDRKHVRYLTLSHLPAAGWSEEEIEACRLGLSKLVNSLSWHARLTPPHAIDEGRTVFRIDLRDYKWNDRMWDRLAAAHPYLLSTTTEGPAVLRADWFVATASRPPFYYDLLQVPAADKALERLLQVDAAASIQETTARRTGFTDSGVSKNNRVLERHDSVYGAYWRSYDFSTSTERQNILKHPLGPPPASDSFVQAGGEMIFHLPNGLFGFFVADAAGKRVDRAPVEIVSDPQRPDKIVEAAVSCFNCHGKGYIPKADQVRAHVLKNVQAFAKDDVQAVLALYRPDAQLKKLLDEDNQRYHAALARLGIKPDDADPISRTTLRYEGLVDLKIASAEMGLRPADFSVRLQQSESLRRQLGALAADGGTVQRDTFLAALRELAEEMRKSDPTTTATKRDYRPFAGHTDRVATLAFSADGRRAASAGRDRTIRVWDVPAGKQVLLIHVPVEEVAALAFSADGKRLLGAGKDSVVRLWDLETGKLILDLKGHTDAVRCVAFAPDGRTVVSGSDDRTARLWDLASGREVRSFVLGGGVRCVAFAPDGGRVLATAGPEVRVWDAASGNAVSRCEGHTGTIHAAAFAPDGKRIVTGGADRDLRVWDAATGKDLLLLKGHANPVIALGFSPDGKQIISTSSRYQQADRTLRIWDAATGREAREIDGAEKDEVRGAAIAPDGRSALTLGGDPQIRFWKLD